MILIANRIDDATNDNTNGTKGHGNNCYDHRAPNNQRWQLLLSYIIITLKSQKQDLSFLMIRIFLYKNYV
jgi:hypothetical protein